MQPALMQGMLLTLTVEDLSAALRDEPIGQLSIPLLQLMTRKEWEGWFDLRSIKNIGPTTGDASITHHTHTCTCTTDLLHIRSLLNHGRLLFNAFFLLQACRP